MSMSAVVDVSTMLSPEQHKLVGKLQEEVANGALSPTQASAERQGCTAVNACTASPA